MMSFWFFAVVLTALVAFILVRPLLCRPQQQEEESLLDLNRRVFRERLVELEKDESEGRIDAETLAELRTELKRSLLALDVKQEFDVSNTRKNKGLIIATLVLIPVAALSFYHFKMESKALQPWWQLRVEMGPVIDRLLKGGEPVEGETDGRTLADFIRVLQDRLQQHPENADGWFMLGISYSQLGMAASAQTAFEHANRYAPTNPRYQIAYAQARIYGNEGRLDAESRRLLEGVVTAEPAHEGALLLLGLSAYRSEDYATTVSALERLEALRAARHVDVTGGVPEIAEALTNARIRLAHKGSDISAATAEVQTVQVRVRVHRNLVGKFDPSDTVFVFARALQGPPMPVAAAKRQAGDLPFTVMLDDSSSVMPTHKLSMMKEVVITARIARHPGPEAQAGDLEAIAVPVRLNGKSQDVELIVSEIKK